ncbi:MAG: DNA-directed RNA polymerase subunit D [Thermoplasmata archaeon]|nr:DNA-directed RNA polymerase subunit D [Thermoplasmata archaeon]
MKIEIRELEETRATLIISDATPYLVNSLRRVLIANTPKMAIEEVEFHMGTIRDEEGREYSSQSALFDEIIAHRLAMVPIPTDLKMFNFRDKCSCGGVGCPLCTLMFVINKRGPCTVYSGDLQPIGDSRFRVKEELIPIVKLRENQALLIYATAVLGTGEQHAKWQPVTICGYQYYPKITIDNNRVHNAEGCAATCPRKALSVDKKKNLVVADLEACNLCRNCVENCEEGAIKVEGDQRKFIFRFETDGSLTAKDALEYALNYLQEKFSEFREELSKAIQ